MGLIKGLVSFVSEEYEVLLEAHLNDGLLLLVENLSLLFGMCKCAFLGISAEACCFLFNPFEDT